MGTVNRAVVTALGYEPKHYDVDLLGWPRTASAFRQPYEGRHRAERRCACGQMDCQGHAWTAEDLKDFGVYQQRPPSPGYSFTLVEQPGGAS